MVKASLSEDRTVSVSLYNWPTSSRPAPVSRKVRRKRRRVNSYPLTPIALELTGFESGGRAVGRAVRCDVDVNAAVLLLLVAVELDDVVVGRDRAVDG